MVTQTQEKQIVEAKIRGALLRIRVAPKVRPLEILRDADQSGRYTVRVNRLVDQATFEKHFTRVGLTYLGSGWNPFDGHFLKVREQ